MQFQILYKNSVKKELQKITQFYRVAIVRKIELLKNNPRPIGSAKLTGSVDLFRIRHGDYRVIYKIQNNVLTIIIIKVGHRRDIYKNR